MAGRERTDEPDAGEARPPGQDEPIRLPSADEIRYAVELYLTHAYPDRSREDEERLMPPASFDPAEWLMSDRTERDPSDAPLEGVRSFALRLGNAGYPHMKLRLSRPPRQRTFVFSVDAHDAFLQAPPGSADAEALETLKQDNARIARSIHAAWEDAGLLTERTYLRGKLAEARSRGETPAAGREDQSPDGRP